MKPSRSIYAGKLNEFPDLVFADDAAFGQRDRWRDYFRRGIGPGFDGKIIFEIGCFDASYLSRIAAKHPCTGFVGLDWKCKAIFDGAQRVAELGIGNVALLRGRAQDIRQIFGEAEVDEIWVFHPDPCDREVEQKNRLIAEPFLVDVHRALRDNSILALKTDHPGYYQWVLGLFGHPALEWLGSVRARDILPADKVPQANAAILRRFTSPIYSADFWNDPVVLAHVSNRAFAGETTLFENRFINKRLPIYYFEMQQKR